VGQAGGAGSGGGQEVIPLFPLETPLFPGVVLPLHIFEPRYRRLIADLTALPADAPRRFGVVAIRQGWEVERVAPAEALYDVGCTAVLRMVAPQRDGGYRVAAVGGERFRLLDVLLPAAGGQDAEDERDAQGGEPPYLRALVEWLAEEEAAEEAAGDADGLVGADTAAGIVPEDVVTEVARGSLEVLAGNVRDLFARYVADVAVRQGGAPDGLPDEVLDSLTSEDLPDDEAAGEVAATAALLREVSHDARGLSYLVASSALLTTEDRQALLAESATRRRLAMESRLLRRELTLLRTLGAVPVPLRQFATPMTSN
jgi:Lon protease-like protein